MGIRKAVFTGFRMDGKLEKIEIGTHRATHNAVHLYKLFEDKISTIEPDPGNRTFYDRSIENRKNFSASGKTMGYNLQVWKIPGLSELMDI